VSGRGARESRNTRQRLGAEGALKHIGGGVRDCRGRGSRLEAVRCGAVVHYACMRRASGGGGRLVSLECLLYLHYLRRVSCCCFVWLRLLGFAVP
jgi:hypothetical protein